MLFSIAANVDIDDYSWYRYKGKKKIVVKNVHRRHDFILRPEEIFGVNKQVARTGNVLVVKQEALHITYRIPHRIVDKLLERSESYRGKIEEVEKIRTQKIQGERDPLNRFKPKREVTNEKRVIDRTNYQWRMYVDPVPYKLLGRTGLQKTIIKPKDMIGMRFVNSAKGGYFLDNNEHRFRINTQIYDELASKSKILPKDKQKKGVIDVSKDKTEQQRIQQQETEERIEEQQGKSIRPRPIRVRKTAVIELVEPEEIIDFEPEISGEPEEAQPDFDEFEEPEIETPVEIPEIEEEPDFDEFEEPEIETPVEIPEEKKPLSAKKEKLERINKLMEELEQLKMELEEMEEETEPVSEEESVKRVVDKLEGKPKRPKRVARRPSSQIEDYEEEETELPEEEKPKLPKRRPVNPEERKRPSSLVPIETNQEEVENRKIQQEIQNAPKVKPTVTIKSPVPPKPTSTDLEDIDIMEDFEETFTEEELLSPPSKPEIIENMEETEPQFESIFDEDELNIDDLDLDDENHDFENGIRSKDIYDDGDHLTVGQVIQLTKDKKKRNLLIVDKQLNNENEDHVVYTLYDITNKPEHLQQIKLLDDSKHWLSNRAELVETLPSRKFEAILDKISSYTVK